jgi:AraC-like DNA-binding protein
VSLTAEDLAAAGCVLVGRDIMPPVTTLRFRPSFAVMSHLSSLHTATSHLAATAPNLLANVEVARAIENELLRAMIACIVEGVAARNDLPDRGPVSVMTRFRHLLEENRDRPMYLTEICAALGVSDRTLRTRCTEYLGMTPHRYLWMRRMKLVRRALTLADPLTETVTEIATDHGFWELGRFSVAYRGLFGEAPSATLRRAPHC